MVDIRFKYNHPTKQKKILYSWGSWSSDRLVNCLPIVINVARRQLKPGLQGLSLTRSSSQEPSACLPMLVLLPLARALNQELDTGVRRKPPLFVEWWVPTCKPSGFPEEGCYNSDIGMALPSRGPEMESPSVLSHGHSEPFFATLLEKKLRLGPHFISQEAKGCFSSYIVASCICLRSTSLLPPPPCLACSPGIPAKPFPVTPLSWPPSLWPCEQTRARILFEWPKNGDYGHIPIWIEEVTLEDKAKFPKAPLWLPASQWGSDL